MRITVLLSSAFFLNLLLLSVNVNTVFTFQLNTLGGPVTRNFSNDPYQLGLPRSHNRYFNFDLKKSSFSSSSLLPFCTSTSNLNFKMDDNLSKATSHRISALFSYNQVEAGKDAPPKRDFSTKNRTKELKRLAQSMNINVPQLKSLLKKQRPKLQNGTEKADYVDWILTKEKKQNNNGNSNSNKRIRNNSDVMEEKKIDEGGPLPGSVPESSAVNISDKQPKKKIRPTRPQRQSTANKREGQEQAEATERTMESTTASIQDSSLLSNMKFQDLPMHKNSKRALAQVLKLEYMTEIQSKTFEFASQGRDVLGRARTGTGKTMAFLLPALERIVTQSTTKSNASSGDNANTYQPGSNIGILVISPTRELAIQIGDQAEKLLTYHKDLSCQVMYGGTKMGRDVNFLNKKLPSILVATPGRLLDHLQNTKLANGRKFGYDIMRETGVLVLDETDRLLDMGFRRDIEQIMTFLPKQERRQTLLFSATVPKELKKIMADNMKSDFIEVDCIKDGGNNAEPGQHTNTLVDQTYVVLSDLDNLVTSVVQLVHNYMNKEPNSKIVVFFPTARMVGYFAQFFNMGLGIDVIEIHSKKSQSFRNKASDKFRKAKSAVMFTSDVSARGVDYPDVTGVIQVGLPESREQYIHRLGRTGRAGKKGEGLLLLAPFEKKFVSELKNLDIARNEEASKLIASVDDETYQSVQKVLNRVRSGDATLSVSADQCYAAFLGYYRGHMKRTTIRSKDELVSIANALSEVLGCKEQPGLTPRTVGKMGLKGTKGLRIVSESELRSKLGGNNSTPRNNNGRQRNGRR